MERQIYDVAIVGAGMSGITAARELTKSGKSVILIEARDRYGGRIYSNINKEDGCILEYGATWVGLGQENMYNLLKEFGLKTFLQPVAGQNKQKFEGVLSEYTGNIPPLPLLSLVDLQQSFVRTDYQSSRLDELSEEELVELDKKPASEFINEITYTDGGRSFYRACVRSLCCTEPENVSAYVWLDSIHGDINFALDCENGAQQDRIEGGVYQILEKMLESIDKNYFKILYSTPVRRIVSLEDGLIQGLDSKEIDDDKPHATADNDAIFTAKTCIVAVPPLVTNNIQFFPPLSEAQSNFLNDFRPGCITKAIVRYDSPWWNENGFSGYYFSDELINFMCDHSHVSTNKNDGIRKNNFYALVCFVLATWQEKFNSHSIEERKKIIVEEIHKIYQIDDALNPSNYYEQNWTKEEFSRGCYSDINNLGFFSRHGTENIFEEGIGKNKNVFFCCSEYADEWTGYMEGAIISAKYTASKVINKLQYS